MQFDGGCREVEIHWREVAERRGDGIVEEISERFLRVFPGLSVS
jgi:hypothetical protein